MREIIYVTQVDQSKEHTNLDLQKQTVLLKSGKESITLKQDAILKNQDLDRTIENIYYTLDQETNLVVILLDQASQFSQQNYKLMDRFQRQIKSSLPPKELNRETSRDGRLKSPQNATQTRPKQKQRSPQAKQIKKLEVSMFGIYKDEIIDLTSSKVNQVRSLKVASYVIQRIYQNFDQVQRQAERNLQSYQRILRAGEDLNFSYFVELYFTKNSKVQVITFARIFIDNSSNIQDAMFQLFKCYKEERTTSKSIMISKEAQALFRIMDKSQTVILANQLLGSDQLLSTNFTQCQFVSDLQKFLGDEAGELLEQRAKIQSTKQVGAFDNLIEEFMQDFQEINHKFNQYKTSSQQRADPEYQEELKVKVKDLMEKITQVPLDTETFSSVYKQLQRMQNTLNLGNQMINPPPQSLNTGNKQSQHDLSGVIDEYRKTKERIESMCNDSQNNILENRRTSSFSFKNQKDSDAKQVRPPSGNDNYQDKLEKKRRQIQGLQQKLEEMETLYREQEETFELYKKKARESKGKSKELIKKYKEENQQLVEHQRLEQEKIKRVLQEYRESQEDMLNLQSKFEQYKIECQEHLQNCLSVEQQGYEKILKAKDKIILELEQEKQAIINDNHELIQQQEVFKIEYKKAFDEQNSTTKLLNQKAHEINADNTQLLNKLQSAEQREKDLMKQVQSLEATINTIRNDNRSIMREKESIHLKVRQLENELVETKELLLIQDKKLEKTQSQAQKSLEDEISKLKDGLKSKKSKIKQFKNQIKDLQLKQQTSETSLELSKQSNQQIKDTLIQQERRVQTLEDQIKQKDRSIGQIEADKISLQQQLTKFINEKSQLEQALSVLEGKMYEKTQDYEQLEQKFHEERKQLRELRYRQDQIPSKETFSKQSGISQQKFNDLRGERVERNEKFDRNDRVERNRDFSSLRSKLDSTTVQYMSKENFFSEINQKPIRYGGNADRQNSSSYVQRI